MFSLSKSKSGHRPDYIFIFCVAILTIFGLVLLSSASSDLGKIKFNDTYYYLKHQIIFGLSLGLIGFFVASRMYYKKFKKLAVPLLIINLILLFLVFTPLGVSHMRSSRWLSLGPFSLQPAELLKISFIVYLAAWLAGKSDRQSSLLKGLAPFLIVSGIIAVLILKQPATTMLVILMAAAMAIYFISGARISHILAVFLLGLSILALIIYLTPYRYERIMSFLTADKENQQTIAYQLRQSLNAIGSGGLFGVGFGQSTAKYKYLPEPIGDSIFAVIAEELGFAGSIFIISVFTVILIRIFSIIRKSSDQFAKLMAVGFASIMGIQAFIHIAAISGLLPLTGVSLPFISYGGTSLAIFLTISGIIVNISKHT